MTWIPIWILYFLLTAFFFLFLVMRPTTTTTTTVNHSLNKTTNHTNNHHNFIQVFLFKVYPLFRWFMNFHYIDELVLFFNCRYYFLPIFWLMWWWFIWKKRDCQSYQRLIISGQYLMVNDKRKIKSDFK